MYINWLFSCLLLMTFAAHSSETDDENEKKALVEQMCRSEKHLNITEKVKLNGEGPDLYFFYIKLKDDKDVENKPPREWIIDCTAYDVGPVLADQFPSLENIVDQKLCSLDASSADRSSLRKVLNLIEDASEVASKAACLEGERTPLLSKRCGVELGCNLARSLVSSTSLSVLAYLRPLLKTEDKPADSCLDFQKSNCLTEVGAGIVKNIWANIEGVGFLLKTAANYTWKGITSFTDNLFGSEDSIEVEDKSSDAMLLASSTSSSWLDDFKKDPQEFMVNLGSSIYDYLMKAIANNFACDEWSGVPHISKCKKYLESWECSSCDQRLNGVCGVLGFAGGEIVTALITGGTLNLLGKAGRATGVAKAFSDLGTTLGKSKVLTTAAKVGLKTVKVAAYPIVLLAKIPGLKQYIHATDKAFMYGLTAGKKSMPLFSTLKAPANFIPESHAKFPIGDYNRGDETLYLLSEKQFNALPDRTVLYSIDGNRKIKGVDDINMDAKEGLIAFGFKESQLPSGMVATKPVSKAGKKKKAIKEVVEAPYDFVPESHAKRPIGDYNRGDETLYLLSEKQFNALPDRTVLYSIDGSRKIKGVDDINMDTREGLIAFGFKESQLPEGKIIAKKSVSKSKVEPSAQKKPAKKFKEIEEAPDKILFEKGARKEVGSLNKNPEAIYLINSLQFDQLPRGSVLYDDLGHRLIKGYDDFSFGKPRKLSSYGFRESQLGSRVSEITKAPPGLVFTERVKSQVVKDDKIENFYFLIKEQYEKLPNGTVLYDYRGNKFVKGLDNIKTSVNEGMMSVGFKESQLDKIDEINTAPDFLVFNKEGLLKEGKFNSNTEDLNLITLEQFESLPKGTVLYKLNGDPVVKDGFEKIAVNINGGFMDLGFKKSQIPKIEVSVSAPRDFTFSANGKVSPGNVSGNNENLFLLTTSQYKKLPRGSVVFGIDGTRKIKGVNTLELGVQNGFVNYGFREGQLSESAIKAMKQGTTQSNLGKSLSQKEIDLLPDGSLVYTDSGKTLVKGRDQIVGVGNEKFVVFEASEDHFPRNPQIKLNVGNNLKLAGEGDVKYNKKGDKLGMVTSILDQRRAFLPFKPQVKESFTVAEGFEPYAHARVSPGMDNDNSFSLYLLTPEQFNALPNGTILYSTKATKFVKGIDDIEMNTKGSTFLGLGFIEGQVSKVLVREGANNFIAKGKETVGFKYDYFKSQDVADGVSPSKAGKSPLEDEVLSPSHLSYSKLEPLSGRALDPIEEVLKSGKIVKDEALDGGANATRLVTFEDGTKGIWKPHIKRWFSNYRTEVLAYELDRKFGFNIVPPTVERLVFKYKGSVQLFKDSNSNWKAVSSASSLRKQSFFDFIIHNRDRHSDNHLVSPEGGVISIDNGIALAGKQGHYEKGFFERRKDIKLFLKSDEGKAITEKFKNLDIGEFYRDVKNYLGEEDAQRLVDRIQFIIKHADTLTK